MALILNPPVPRIERCHTCDTQLPHDKICFVEKHTCPQCKKGFLTGLINEFRDSTIKDYYILIESGFNKNTFCSNVMCDYNDKHTDITSLIKQMRTDRK